VPEKTQTVVRPRPGETRDCLDPWKMSFVHADGSVSLCCWSRSIGNIKDARFGELLVNDASREMRRGLLTGRLPEDCVRCPARTLVPVAELRRKVEAFVADDGRQELLRLRGDHYALQEDMVRARRHIESLLGHVANLEDERRHLRLNAATLQAAVDAVREGRGSPVELLYRWTRGRLRRSALGRWWIARRAT